MSTKSPQTDTDRFNEVYGEYHARIKTFIAYIVYNPEDAAHACQETWLKVWKALPQTDEPRFTWVCTIAKNAATDEVRKTMRRNARFSSLDFEIDNGETLGDIIEDPAGDFTEQVAREETIERIMAKINPIYEKALRLSEEGYRYNEISPFIDRKDGKTVYYRARKVFRKEWKQEEEQAGRR